MGLFDKLFKRQERSPSGSPIIRHGQGQERTIGFSDAPAEWMEERERFYDRFFGKCDMVVHEMIPMIPHIDVYIYPPQGGRDYYTLITSGMSDYEMKAPKGVPADMRRTELFMRVRDLGQLEQYTTSHPWQVEVLRFMAAFPIKHNTWFGPLHTVPNGNPPQPLADGSVLTTTFFMPAAFEDPAFTDGITYSNKTKASFLWVDFITTAECDFKLKNGGDALLDLFDKYKHPHVLDPYRRSYV